MAELAALQAYNFVQQGRSMLPLMNDWIRTGHSFLNRIFSLLNHADLLQLIGLKMNAGPINEKLRDFKIIDIQCIFKRECKGGQSPVYQDNGNFLECVDTFSE